MTIRTLFWNPDQRRPRAPWRLLALTPLLLLFAVLAGSVAWLVGGSMPDNPATPAPPVPRVVGTVALGLAVVGAVVVAAVALDRRRLSDLGVVPGGGWLRDFGFGVVLGAGMMTLVVAVELAAGWLTVTDTARVAPDVGGFGEAFAALVVVFLLGAAYEELLVRGYLLRNIAEGVAFFDGASGRTAVVAATLVSSVLFGVGHAFNPDATAASTLGIAAIGTLLAAGYLLTGQLGVPVGVHVAWNVFQGQVYGLPVSGNDVGVHLLVVEQRGPTAMTGGAFGPEAGLLGVGAALAGAAALGWWVRRTRGEVALDDSIATPTLRWRS